MHAWPAESINLLIMPFNQRKNQLVCSLILVLFILDLIKWPHILHLFIVLHCSTVCNCNLYAVPSTLYTVQYYNVLLLFNQQRIAACWMPFLRHRVRFGVIYSMQCHYDLLHLLLPSLMSRWPVPYTPTNALHLVLVSIVKS